MRSQEREIAREIERERERERSTVTREKMETNPKREKKFREMKENVGQISMENKEIARVREKCGWEKSKEKGQEQECEQYRDRESERERTCESEI